MKTLYIVRHAKSSWDDQGLRDFDRPLNERGEKDAPKMGKRLKKHNFYPALIVSSPAVRALATSRLMAKALGYPEEKIKIEKRLYHANEEQMLTILKELGKVDDPEIVMMVGHNPGLTDFANRLSDVIIDNIPTCGIVGGTFDLPSWDQAGWGDGHHEFFDSPKSKD